MEKKPWFVYMIQSGSGALYTGITVDPQRRFSEHLGLKRGGAKFFRLDTPENFVYLEEFGSRSEASKQESKIKKMTRKEKLKLIEGKKHV